MKMMGRRGALAGVVIGAALCAVSGTAWAGMQGSPQCTGPGEQPQVFGRCYTKGYFSGRPNTEGRNAIAPGGGSYTYIPVEFPLENEFAYTENWSASTHWAFPSVRAPGVYTFNGTSVSYTGGGATKNASYAQMFTTEIGAYLNGNFGWCSNGAPYVPPAGQLAPAGYNPGANAGNMNYVLDRYATPTGISSGSACYNLRRNAVGAAVIINTMMGKQGTEFGSYQAGIASAKNLYATWRQLVLSYDSLGWVNWNAQTVAGPQHLNTTAMEFGQDNEFFAWESSSYNANVITFSNPNSPGVYTINRECANLIGELSELQGFDLHPSVNVDELHVAQGLPATFRFSVNNDGQVAAAGSRYVTTYAVTPGPGRNLPNGPTGTTTFPLGATNLGRTDVDTGLYPPGTKICATLTVGPPAAFDFPGSRSASACTIVVAEPYFNVTGGDVSTGMGMNSNPAGGNDCATSVNTKAGIVSWNQGADAAYAGAGTQYAALALNHLQGFASGQGSSYVPDGLSFANTADGQISRPSSMFGGMFGGSACAPDYFDEAKAVKNNAYMLNPGGTTNVANGDRKILYIDGNVYISRNVIFTGAGAYDNLADIPKFTLVVRGNIFIDPSVSRLDGTYVAQAREDGSGGIIYTCATDGFTVPLLDKNLYGICNQKQLVFNGAVIAKQLWLLRTYGTLTQSSAEQFNYTPEVWLVSPFDTGGTEGGYDAIAGLPPVL